MTLPAKQDGLGIREVSREAIGHPFLSLIGAIETSVTSRSRLSRPLPVRWKYHTMRKAVSS